MDKRRILNLIRRTESPLRKQLLPVALVSRILRSKGAPAPVVVGGCALAYYSREVYFTADIDLACEDRKALDRTLAELGFRKVGRYWVHDALKQAVEAPAGRLPDDEQSHVETVVLGKDLQCRILGIEDLLVDRVNACRHSNSKEDCEMAELLVSRYSSEIDWEYLRRKARPENDCLKDVNRLRRKAGK
jgi:hypothetical protein